MKNRLMVLPHDSKDIGWYITIYENVLHFYRGIPNSRLVMSNCGFPELRDRLLVDTAHLRCTTCETIEKMRNELDKIN